MRGRPVLLLSMFTDVFQPAQAAPVLTCPIYQSYALRHAAPIYADTREEGLQLLTSWVVDRKGSRSRDAGSRSVYDCRKVSGAHQDTYLQATKPLALSTRGSCDCKIGKLPSTTKILKDEHVSSEMAERALPHRRIALRLDVFPEGVIAVGHREEYRLLRRGDKTY